MNNMKKLIRSYKRKRARNPYAKINWEKAAVLFDKPFVVEGESNFPQVKQILQVLAAAGAVGLVFAFPGAALALGMIAFGKKSYPRWQSSQIIGQLERQKYVETKENKDGTTTVKITKKGMVKALTYRLDTLMITKPKRWDKKWRVVIFDIPIKYNRVRDIFRSRLVQMGMYQLQESVYIYPYSCFSEIEFLRELYGVPFTARYLLVEHIENDDFLKYHFELG
ncbi:hypothetical protein A2773_06410 [Candidatus Gottesmanbacteria bacterium RIFCSPHIGHO2_01_FULL_39_10]|uniref:Transcriptional repressor PaaX-like central Cas2-like domain-containing protein n=1 Tax=Candidatus Gottesmanbacteria bacterium RIFCSPHIGHO2_01_FULL_39_10 TaxID=1798375 RepID=A0A1F5ZQ41_9BACT|nr:MAG: hypothetical protein A2773_06410 [Candidatus Gottesmanbacteria bacterium RIFCSPHIGHO2_01_FULL_39_10]